MEISAEAVIQRLTNRIAALSYEVAVLQTQIEQMTDVDEPIRRIDE